MGCLFSSVYALSTIAYSIPGPSWILHPENCAIEILGTSQVVCRYLEMLYFVHDMESMFGIHLALFERKILYLFPINNNHEHARVIA